MGKCRACKFWYRGEKIHYSEDSVNWDGSPHALAGKTIVKKEWAEKFSYGRERDVGECQSRKALPGLIREPRHHLWLTSKNFGCSFWVQDDGADKFLHVYMDYRGQQSLEEYKAEMVRQPDEYAAPIGVIGDPHKINKEGMEGWVLYPDPPDVHAQLKELPTGPHQPPAEEST